MATSNDETRLTRKEIGRLVHNWIGVDGGYLGDFSYASHDRCWLEACDFVVDTHGFNGTTHHEPALQGPQVRAPGLSDMGAR